MFSFLKSDSSPPVLDDDDDDYGNNVIVIVDGDNDGSAVPSAEAPTTLSTTTRRRPPTSWKEAHDGYCRHYGRLRATIQQVLSLDDEELEWSLPTQMEVVVSSDDEQLFVCHHPENEATQTTSSSSSAVSLAKRLAVGLYSSVISWTTNKDEVWDDTHYDDDAFDAAAITLSAADTTELSLTQPIIHVELTRQCLSSILERVPAVVANESYAYRKDAWILVARSDWTRWILQLLSSTETFMQTLIPDDVMWLLQVLVAQNHAKLIVRPDKPDVVVFRADGNRVVTGNQEELEQSLQVPLALYDLQRSIQDMEVQLEQWTLQIEQYSQKALALKKQNQTRLAVVQLSKRKLLQQQIDSSSNTLMQLEHVYAAIETAQSNKTLLSLLSTSSKLLHQLSHETSLESIDQVQEDMQDAMDQVQEQMQTVVNSTAMEDDEDALLAELASLTIQDELPETVLPTLSTTTTTIASEDSPSPTPESSTSKRNDEPKKGTAAGAISGL